IVLRVVFKVMTQCSHSRRCNSRSARNVGVTELSIKSSSSAKNSEQVTEHHPHSSCGSSGSAAPATAAALATTATSPPAHSAPAHWPSLRWRDLLRPAARKLRENLAADR